MRYAVIIDEVVVNVVEWDGETPWQAPDGSTVVPAEDPSIQIGVGYVDGAVVDPEDPE